MRLEPSSHRMLGTELKRKLFTAILDLPLEAKVAPMAWVESSAGGGGYVNRGGLVPGSPGYTILWPQISPCIVLWAGATGRGWVYKMQDAGIAVRSRYVQQVEGSGYRPRMC